MRLKNLMLKIIQVLALISIPLGFFLFSLNEPIEYLVFGEKWKGIGFVIGVMALSQGYAWVIGANGELYRAIGKPAYETIIPLATLVLYIGGYFFSIQKGFETFVWTRFYLAIIGTFLHVLLGWKVAQLSIWKVLRMMFFASIIGFSFFIFKSVLKMHVANPYYQIGLISLFSMALLGSLIFLLKKEDPIKDFMWIIKTKAFQAKR